MKFSIRDLLLVTVIVALAVGWWIDHRRQAKEIKKLYDLEYNRVMHGPLPNSSATTPNPPKP